MSRHRYFMESEEESIRLDVKTDPRSLQKQARWAGLKPGMRVGDLGCGPGKTSFHLNRLARPGGTCLGIDISPRRIEYAREHYLDDGLDFSIGDIREPMDRYGQFDFIWVRFVLEHYRSTSLEIVRNICSALRPGGLLCLADLDHNCLGNYGLSPVMERALRGLIDHMERRADFDPYAGKKLYSYLYDLGLSEIRVNLFPHHLIYGPPKKSDLFNWTKKLEIGARQSGYEFKEYEDGFEGFYAEFKSFFQDPRRFTYSPIIVCRGRKPS